ncbi:phosphonate transport system ATP-binding protein [Crenobacter luteus]|uniref:Phosphonate ABC transporter n=1 Tax=Crenobacter luteus TaxID=1452487 RepID=A0A161S444_9NEIS|nr:ATP-binding cassette domain-containing protein [Crenobacter luteus]KZE25346.1 phosphonate ABC transporter [Crenobacter luteus]TCP11088.1 phosphonate transport system ATP-binding protein [Crenobacter luteus]
MRLALDAVDLTLSGRPVLSGVSFALEAGEQAALIGPSGAGKTSLLMLANTVLRPGAGRVTLGSANPWTLPRARLKALRADIGTVYQHPPLPARQRVAQAVAAGRLGRASPLASLAALFGPRDVDGVAATLARVQLADKLWSPCAELSGGQLQRVGVARALYQAPSLLLADEPVSALDPRLAEATVALLADDARARGATLLMSLHSVELARAHFPRLIGVRAGRIAFDLPREAVDDALLAQLYAGDAAPAEPGPDPAPPLPRDLRC